MTRSASETRRHGGASRIDRSGDISKCGDKLMRHEAANLHLRISRNWSRLSVWGVKLAKRTGMKKACVAVARKPVFGRKWDQIQRRAPPYSACNWAITSRTVREAFTSIAHVPP